MFNFFHNLGLGIVSAFMAFTSAFHSQQPTVAQPTQTQVVSSTTQDLSASTSVQSVPVTPTQVNTKKNITVVRPTDNSAAIQAEVQAQVQATLKAKADAEAQAIAKQKADSQTQIDATNKKAQDDAAYAAMQKSYNDQMALQEAERAKSARLQSPECIGANYKWNQIKDVTFWPLTKDNGASEAIKKASWINAKNTYENACNGSLKTDVQLCMYRAYANDLVCNANIVCVSTDSKGVCVQFTGN